MGPHQPEAPNPVLVAYQRGGRTESLHRGSWVAADPSGGGLAGTGDASAQVYGRSALKPLQVLPLLESGAADAFRVGDEDLALCCASHTGEPAHVERAAQMLQRAGLGPEDLLCGAHAPLDPEVAAVVASNGGPASLHNNCSGKHAGFLLLARQLGVDTADYLAPGSASQRRVREAVESMCGEAAVAGTDGCSAPALAVSLAGLATAVARLVRPPSGTDPTRAAACARVVRAMTAHPWLVGGRQRLSTEVMNACPGVLAKEGYEGVAVAAHMASGVGIAVKVDDGAPRAAQQVLMAVIERLGWGDRSPGSGVLWNHAGWEVGRAEVRLDG
jgi:L-asparaginase II